MILKSNGLILAAAALFGGVMAVAGAVHATSIGVQFYNASTTNSVALTAGQIAGAGSYAQSNWNVASSANDVFYTDAGGSGAYKGSLSTLADGSTGATSVGADGTSVTFNYSDAHKFFQGYTIGASGDPSNTTTDANAILMSGGLENDTAKKNRTIHSDNSVQHIGAHVKYKNYIFSFLFKLHPKILCA